MFERFTDNARQIVVFAEQAAREFNHKAVGTEHLLIALAELDGSPSQQILHNQGYTGDDIRNQLTMNSRKVTGKIPFTKQAKKALEDAIRGVLDRSNKTVSDIDLLLGLLQQNDDTEVITIIKALGSPYAVSTLRTEATDVLQNMQPATAGSESQDMVLVTQLILAISECSDEDLRQILRFVQLSSDERRHLLDAAD